MIRAYLEYLNKLSDRVRDLLFQNRFAASFFFFLFLSLVLSVTRSNISFISQWDELYHLSYVQYVSQGVIPAGGYPMNSWSKGYFSCLPVSNYGVVTLTPCGEQGPGYSYPVGGANTAAGWPPFYFLITAALMIPIEYLLGVSDHLLAARYATGFIWALGVAMLSVLVYRRSGSFLTSTTFGLLGSGLSLFGQASSFVSPHAAVPILAAIALRLAFYVEEKSSYLLVAGFLMERRFSQSLLTVCCLVLAFFGFGALVGLTVPHASPMLIVIGVYIFIGLFQSHVKNLISFFGVVTISGLLLLVATASLFIVSRFWTWQYSVRAIAWPPDVDPSVGDDLGNVTYNSLTEQIFSLWLHFWPGGLSNLENQGVVPALFESTWSYLLPGLLIVAVATLGFSNWISRLTVGLVVASPIASNLAFSLLNFISPERYGLSLLLFGLFGVANQKMTKLFRVFLFVAALSTYVAGYLYSPLPFTEEVCPSGALSWALGCQLN